LLLSINPTINLKTITCLREYDHKKGREEKMKFGVKNFDDRTFFKHFEDEAYFFEVMAIEGKDYSFLKEFNLPIVVHAQHEGFGVNNADKTKITKNESSINFAISMANQYKSSKIILHPGFIADENCSEEQAISFINSIKDKRVLIENLSAREGCFCATPQQTKKFLKATGKDFCFDINHAIMTAIILKQDYLEIIKEFIKLKPNHYHLGGQDLKQNKAHLSFKESYINLKEIIKLIPKDAEITLEVTTDIKKTEEDIKIIKGLLTNI
jgi:endonuclease IV